MTQDTRDEGRTEIVQRIKTFIEDIEIDNARQQLVINAQEVATLVPEDGAEWGDRFSTLQAIVDLVNDALRAEPSGDVWEEDREKIANQVARAIAYGRGGEFRSKEDAPAVREVTDAILARLRRTPETRRQYLPEGDLDKLVRERDESRAEVKRLLHRLSAITAWLEANKPEVFREGMWDALATQDPNAGGSDE